MSLTSLLCAAVSVAELGVGQVEASKAQSAAEQRAAVHARYRPARPTARTALPVANGFQVQPARLRAGAVSRARVVRAEAERPPEEGSGPAQEELGAEKPAAPSTKGSGAGRFTDDEPLPLSFWVLGPRPRRGIIASLLIWGIIAPLTNLYGGGSFLLSLVPGAARDAKLDTFYPVSSRAGYPYNQDGLNYGGGFKRYVDEAKRFEFRYPALYVLDQAIYMRNADAAFERRADPLAMVPSRAGSRRTQQGVAVAVGPEGGTGDENLSVVVGRLEPGFDLRSFGTPEDFARQLLNNTINKQTVVAGTTLLDAMERRSAQSNLPLYQFEYRVDYVDETQPPSYTICVVGAASDVLYTFTSRVPEAVWREGAGDLREAAESFVLLG